MSETIQASLAKVMHDVREVAKKDRNTAQNFSFRGIDAVVNAVAPALRAHNVVVMPHVEEYNFNNMTTSGGKSAMHVTLKVRYRFTGQEGDFLDSVVMGEAIDYGDKAVSKAMSVAFRTVLLQALVLPTDDVDPDAQSYERSNARQSYQATAAAPVGVANETDPWAVVEKPQAEHISTAIDEMAARIERAGKPMQMLCKGCHDNKPMTWMSGISKKNQPYGKFDCWTCKDIIWYVIDSKTGFWREQAAK